jgi:anthranilate 1,2-dioxygenase small subunit
MENIKVGYRKSLVGAKRAAELRLEIEAFNADYCALLDSGAIEDWPHFFSEDCIYRVTSRENADLNMHDRAIAISRTQMFAPRYMRHINSNVRVLDESESGLVTAHSNFLLLQTLVEGTTTVHMTGVYEDVFERGPNGLLLKDRQVIYDTSIIANDLVYPV